MPNIGYRYLVAFIYPITATIRPFLAMKGKSPDEVEKMYQGLVQVGDPPGGALEPFLRPGGRLLIEERQSRRIFKLMCL